MKFNKISKVIFAFIVMIMLFSSMSPIISAAQPTKQEVLDMLDLVKTKEDYDMVRREVQKYDDLKSNSEIQNKFRKIEASLNAIKADSDKVKPLKTETSTQRQVSAPWARGFLAILVVLGAYFIYRAKNAKSKLADKGIRAVKNIEETLKLLEKYFDLKKEIVKNNNEYAKKLQTNQDDLLIKLRYLRGIIYANPSNIGNNLVELNKSIIENIRTVLNSLSLLAQNEEQIAKISSDELAELNKFVERNRKFLELHTAGKNVVDNRRKILAAERQKVTSSKMVVDDLSDKFMELQKLLNEEDNLVGEEKTDLEKNIVSGYEIDYKRLAMFAKRIYDKFSEEEKLLVEGIIRETGILDANHQIVARQAQAEQTIKRTAKHIKEDALQFERDEKSITLGKIPTTFMQILRKYSDDKYVTILVEREKDIGKMLKTAKDEIERELEQYPKTENKNILVNLIMQEVQKKLQKKIETKAHMPVNRIKGMLIQIVQMLEKHITAGKTSLAGFPRDVQTKIIIARNSILKEKLKNDDRKTLAELFNAKVDVIIKMYMSTGETKERIMEKIKGLEKIVLKS